jgi:cytochrome P450 family 49 subfamily A
MKYIMIAMNSSQSADPQNMSLLHKILKETKNPKIAAVLALDLMLVGVDTVRN